MSHYLNMNNYPDMDYATGHVRAVVPDFYLDGYTNSTETELVNAESKNVSEYIDKFQAFYEANYILISVIQWVVILILFIKLSKK